MSLFSILAAFCNVCPSVHPSHLLSNYFVDVSVSVLLISLFPSQLGMIGDLGCLWRQAVARAVRGSTWSCSGSGADWPEGPRGSGPSPGRAVVEQTKDFILCGGRGGVLGDEESKTRGGSWRTTSKGSYPPGSNTCHQLLPPSCAFIKKPSCAPQGNPHALLKKCEVNTVCLSISLP